MLANLKALRTAQGLSQRALADFVKVSQQSINQYENRDTEPDIAVLTRIADYSACPSTILSVMTRRQANSSPRT